MLHYYYTGIELFLLCKLYVDYGSCTCTKSKDYIVVEHVLGLFSLKDNKS
jgi:hypothetical protein